MKNLSEKNHETNCDDIIMHQECGFLFDDSMFFERSPLNGIKVPPEENHLKSDTSQLNELPLRFIGRGEVRGFEFEQIVKNDWGYVYKVRQPGLQEYYEVFKRIENSRFNRVSYPGSNSFGISAWTCKSQEDAMIRFNTTIHKETHTEILPFEVLPEVQDLLSLFDDM